VLATADQGTMHFEIGSGQIRPNGGPGLHLGIWSGQTRAKSCAVGL
jgi:hypothetical protein